MEKVDIPMKLTIAAEPNHVRLIEATKPGS